MAEVTQELVYELLKRMQADISELKYGQSDMRAELNSMRGTMVAVQQDIHNMYGVMERHSHRLERIESRLELRELSESQTGFEPHP